MVFYLRVSQFQQVGSAYDTTHPAGYAHVRERCHFAIHIHTSPASLAVITSLEVFLQIPTSTELGQIREGPYGGRFGGELSCSRSRLLIVISRYRLITGSIIMIAPPPMRCYAYTLHRYTPLSKPSLAVSQSAEKAYSHLCRRSRSKWRVVKTLRAKVR